MSVGPEHVAAAVMSQFQIGPARVVCVGGLWYGRVNEQAGTPYAKLTVTAEETKRISDGRYHRPFMVKIDAWGDDGAAKSGGAGTCRAALESMMVGLQVPEAIKVVDVHASTCELTVEPSPRNAKDVALASLEWKVLIEAR